MARARAQAQVLFQVGISVAILRTHPLAKSLVNSSMRCGSVPAHLSPSARASVRASAKGLFIFLGAPAFAHATSLGQSANAHPQSMLQCDLPWLGSVCERRLVQLAIDQRQHQSPCAQVVLPLQPLTMPKFGLEPTMQLLKLATLVHLVGFEAPKLAA